MLDYFAANAERRFSAAEIHDAMDAAGMNANLTTVYRNLEKLAEEGLLSKRRTAEDTGEGYQYLPPELDCGEHLHLVCRCCGRVIHLNCGFMQEISDHLLAEHGFAIDCRESTLVGLCGDCRLKMRAANPTDSDNVWKSSLIRTREK